MTSEGILVKIIHSLDWGDFDFLLNYPLAKPDGFDGIVFAARSKLRRWHSCDNQSTRIVLVDGYVHSARTRICCHWVS